MDWYSFFLLGNLIADTAIALFAYKVSIFDKEIDKLSLRKRYLYVLCNLIKSIEITGNDGSKKVNKIDFLKLNDEFIINLELNIFPEDKKQLLGLASFNKEPKDGMEIQKYTIYENKKIIPGLIKKAENDYQEKIDWWLNKYILNYLLYMFFLGIILQLGSWIYGSLDLEHFLRCTNFLFQSNQ